MHISISSISVSLLISDDFFAIFRSVLWHWEPQDVITDIVFKFDVGVEFPVGTLRLKVSVNSLEFMIVKSVDCGKKWCTEFFKLLRLQIRLSCGTVDINLLVI